MKKILILSLLLAFTLAFGQTKKKKSKVKKVVPSTKTIPAEERINTIKGDPEAIDYTTEIGNAPTVPDFGENDNTIYNSAGVEIRPEFFGGIAKFYQFFYSNYKPSTTINGRILITFIIEKDGSLTDIKVSNADSENTKEVLRVMKLSPKWNPANQNGLKVRCSYVIPINGNGKQ